MPQKPRSHTNKLSSHQLGRLSRAWKGWQMAGDKIIGPTPDLLISVHDAKAIPLMHAKIEVQRQEISELREQIEALKRAASVQEQSLPEAWIIPTLSP
jgi:hypothetical protein